MREALTHFYSSRYTAALNALDRLRPRLTLDLHLHDHVAPLYHAIRSKALTQYAAPFCTLDLNTMAAAFNTSLE